MLGNERVGETPLCKLTVESLMKSSAELASVWRMTGKTWRHMGRIVEKSRCGCFPPQVVRTVGVERKRRKQTIADNTSCMKPLYALLRAQS